MRSRAARDRESPTFSSILTRCPPVLGPSSQLLAVPCLPLTWGQCDVSHWDGEGA